MPLPRKSISLSGQIESILTTVAQQIADSVRADITAQLQQAMGGVPRRSSSAPAVNTPTRRGRRSSLSEATLTRVLDAIKKTPKLRSEELQKQLALEPKLVKAALTKLRAAKRVKTTGQKRSMTYSAA